MSPTPAARPARTGPPTSPETPDTRLEGLPLTLAILALAAGGFAIGTTEFVTMGLLPQIADGVGVSIPEAGHVISVYAVGVVIGAPVIAVLGARLPRRLLLLVLMSVFVAGNAASALAGTYGLLLTARFLSGVPHGAYFGVASLMVASFVEPRRRGRAVSRVMLGLSVANIVGVPAATALGQSLGWRSAYWTVAVLGSLTVAAITLVIPSVPGDPAATGGRELSALARPQVWFMLAAGALGFGGMFAIYSYIAPTVTEVGGLSPSAVPWFLLVYGLGMTIGTFAGGLFADWSVLRSLLLSSAAMALACLAFSALAHTGWPALAALFTVAAVSSVLVVNLQLRLMHVAGRAQTLGAALNHSSLNLANALGAWLGGVVIAGGHGYTAPAVVGAMLSTLGLGIVALAGVVDRRTPAPVL